MYTILKGAPPIKTFPDDDKVRVVWTQMAVYKNLNGTTNVPNAEVMLKEVLDDGSLNEEPVFVYVAVSELDIVRPMTIWIGNKRIEQTWNKFKSYRTGVDFSFNFDVNKPETIKFGDKKPNSKYGYFPPYVYNLGTISNKAKLVHCLNSRFTKLTTSSGTIVLIPSLEFFTSTFTPHEKEIRNKLLQYPLDKILHDYICSAHVKDDKYILELIRGKVPTNEAFLAYANFNKITRARLQELRNSLETYSGYPERYPVVLPYHPHNLDILADGVWIDNETFFAFRVTDYSLPEEYEVNSVSLEFENNSTPSSDEENDKTYIRYPQELDEDNDTPLGNDFQPYAGNGSKYITSEVGVLNANNCNIKHVTKTVKKENFVQRDYESTDDINELSSSESSQSEEFKNIGKAKTVPKESDNSHMNQSAVLKMVKEALMQMRDEEINITKADDEEVLIKDILFVGEDCSLSTEQMTTQFSRTLKRFKRKVTSWTKKKKNIDGKRKFVGYRNYMLIKIVLNNQKFAYIFEIDRKDIEKGFLGLVFNLYGSEVNDNNLEGLLNSVMENNGKYVKSSIGIEKFMTFKHYEKEGSMIQNVKNTISNAYNGGFFHL